MKRHIRELEDLSQKSDRSKTPIYLFLLKGINV